MFEQFPKILQYGVSGLVAIFAYLTFELLRQQSKKTKPDRSLLNLIRSFMVLSFLSALLVVLSSIFQKESRQAGANEVQSQYQQALTRLVADRFESSLDETKGKDGLIQDPGPLSMTQEDIEYRSLRRAAFLNLLDYQGDSDILRQSLEVLAKRGRSSASSDANKLVGELVEIRRQKLKWLREEAIPALQKDIDYLQRNPMIQRTASAVVKLPEIAWVLNQKTNDLPTVTVNNMASLQEEVEVIKEAIK